MIGLFNVENKIVLITGSTRGLGLSLAKGFSDAGATVIINGRKQSEVDSVVKHIQDHGGQAYGAAFDVTKAEDIEESIQNIEKEVGPISVLINNAGIHRRNPLEELSLEDWQTVLDVNLTSAFNTFQNSFFHI